MNLQITLKLAGLNRNTYNTIERRAGLAFMKKGLLPTTGYDRYTLVHAAALCCMLEFQAAGLELARAVEATDEFFGVIDGIVFGQLAEGKCDPAGAWLTVINYADGGWGWASGAENADTFGGGSVTSKVSVNVVGVWERMTARLGENDVIDEEMAASFLPKFAS